MFEDRTAILRRRDEAVEVTHRARRQIVQHDERVRLREGERQRALDPRLRAHPVLWNHIPEHAGVGIPAQVIERLAVEEASIDLSAATERAKEAPCVGEVADQFFRSRDLGDGDAGLRTHSKRHDVIVGVIADPVAFGVGALGEPAPFAHLLSDHEECGADVMASQRVEHVRRHIRVRAVVERERDGGHDVLRFGSGCGPLGSMTPLLVGNR